MNKKAKVQIIETKRRIFKTVEEANTASNFNILNPTFIPNGYNLLHVQHFIPDSKDEQFNKNETVILTYINGKNNFLFRQGHFSGAQVLAENVLNISEKNELTEQNVFWTYGRVLIKDNQSFEDAEKGWDGSVQQLGWDKGGLGYRLESSDLNLDQLIKVARSVL